VVVLDGAGARGAQDDKSKAGIKIRIEVKGAGQECPSHTIKSPRYDRKHIFLLRC